MRVATDIGGTFTDLVLVDEKGNIQFEKSDTTPGNFEQGVMDVIEKAALNGDDIQTFIHGTTVIINTLTERNGVKTGLLTTKGFRDVLEIARGNRPDLYNFRYRKPPSLVPRQLSQEVEERLNFKGEIIKPLNKGDIEKAVKLFQKEGVESIAICFLHSYINPLHEQAAAKIIKELWPEVSLTISTEVTKEWREYERTSTTVLNSYVKPIAEQYIDRLENRLIEQGLSGQRYVMQSNSGTTTFEQSKVTPIQIVESGPVAGVFGAAILGQMISEPNIIAFDIGGTTAKCSLIDNGEVNVTTEYRIERDERNAGYPINVPVVDIVEVGNGGGSIAWIDEAGSLKVGPKSAGALPGPVAYGKGGTEPTTTDANLVTGRLSPKNFASHVDLSAVRKAIEDRVANHFGVSVEDAALGIIRIANSNMLNALKLISIRRGYDPRDFSMVAFGGGGPMHAGYLAKELGVKRVIVPMGASVFAAWGMLMTDLRHDYLQTYTQQLSNNDNVSELILLWQKLEQEAFDQYKREGVEPERVVFTRYADIRYQGQEHTVKVPIPGNTLTEKSIEEINNRFHELHEKNFTFKLIDNPTEIVNLHLVATGTVNKPTLAKVSHNANAKKVVKEVRPVYYEDIGWIDTKVYDRVILPIEKRFSGPAIIEEPTTSIIIYEGQEFYIDEYGNVVIEMGVLQ